MYQKKKESEDYSAPDYVDYVIPKQRKPNIHEAPRNYQSKKQKNINTQQQYPVNQKQQKAQKSEETILQKNDKEFDQKCVYEFPSLGPLEFQPKKQDEPQVEEFPRMCPDLPKQPIKKQKEIVKINKNWEPSNQNPLVAKNPEQKKKMQEILNDEFPSLAPQTNQSSQKVEQEEIFDYTITEKKVEVKKEKQEIGTKGRGKNKKVLLKGGFI